MVASSYTAGARQEAWPSDSSCEFTQWQVSEERIQAVVARRLAEFDHQTEQWLGLCEKSA